ncbi:MAG: rod shape-determining protein MreD [Lachnospiraceae bacterium]|nr:rod shape-determining protein MreD [Lachnospiraceae bacterium]
MRRVITLGFLIIFNFILQSTIFGFHDVSSISPNLMLILTMSFGLMRGRKEGLLVGFFCGFLADCMYATIMGPYMFIYMIIGYINGFFHKNYIIEDALLPLIVIIFDELFFNVSIYIVFFFLNNRLNFGDYMMDIIIPETLSTTLLTVIIYKLYVLINKQLKKRA